MQVARLASPAEQTTIPTPYIVRHQNPISGDGASRREEQDLCREATKALANDLTNGDEAVVAAPVALGAMRTLVGTGGRVARETR